MSQQSQIEEITEDSEVNSDNGRTTGYSVPANNSTLKLLQSLADTAKQPETGDDQSLLCDDSIELSQSRTEGSVGVIEQDHPQSPGAQDVQTETVKLRSAEDNILSALKVIPSTKPGGIYGSGNDQLKSAKDLGQMLQKYSKNLKLELSQFFSAKPARESPKALQVQVIRKSYECGFVKCFCTIDGLPRASEAWVLFTSKTGCQVDLSVGEKLYIYQPYYSLTLESGGNTSSQEVILCTQFATQMV